MRIEPFKPEHMVGLCGRMNASQALPETACTAEFGENLKKCGEAYTGFDSEGNVIAICGTVKLWANRTHLWAYMSMDAGKHMLAITRAVSRYLDLTDCERVELEVAEGFEPGHRWARMLGFKCETPEGMARFFPGGRRGFLYSKVKP